MIARGPILFKIVLVLVLIAVGAPANLSSHAVAQPTGPPLGEGHQKFLGNVFSRSASRDQHFELFWNQVTPENAGKWGSVQGNRNLMSWSGLDAAYALAKSNGLSFRFHVLVWGNQQPGWIATLADEPEEQLEEVENWFRAVAERYPEIDFLEVVNEPLHDPPSDQPTDPGSGNYVDALGGAGETGWDWVLNAFRMARNIFSASTKLLINEYNILSSDANVSRYVEIIELLQEEDLIDGIGVQGHAFSTRGSASDMIRRLDRLAERGLPIQITEMDVDGNPTQIPGMAPEESDQNQLIAMQRIFPALWEHPAVEGITLWGWKPGMWRTPQEAYLIRSDGSERPAMVWMREYLDGLLVNSTNIGELPEESLLHANFPNPFSTSTQISYHLMKPTDVAVDVYDVLGRHIRTLVSGMQPPGLHAVDFEAGTLTSGVYVCRLRAGAHVESTRMILLKQ